MPLKQPKGISVERNVPSGGRAFARVQFNGSTIGGIEIVDGVGFIPFGCRKPLPTLNEAVRKVLAKKVEGLRREANRLESYMDVEIGES